MLATQNAIFNCGRKAKLVPAPRQGAKPSGIIGLPVDVLSDIVVISEDAGLVMHPVNNVTYNCDGFRHRFRNDWFKVPDHCAVEVHLPPASANFYSQCCNFAAGLFEDDPHRSNYDLAVDKRNPFGATE